MNITGINTFEDFHHLCLMYGLKKAYMKFPFFVRNIMATPPPFRRNPSRPRVFIGSRSNAVSVQYYKTELVILCEDEKISSATQKAFAKAVMEEYLHLRHPYMKTEWAEGKLISSSSKMLIAEII